MSSSSLTGWLEGGCGWRQGSRNEVKMTQRGSLIEIPNQELDPKVSLALVVGAQADPSFKGETMERDVLSAALLLEVKNGGRLMTHCSSWGRGRSFLCAHMKGWNDGGIEG